MLWLSQEMLENFLVGKATEFVEVGFAKRFSNWFIEGVRLTWS